jgi:replication factor A1
MMEIKDLKPRMGKIEIVVTVKDIQEPKEFDRFGKTLRVVNATAVDSTGSVNMSIWNEDIDKVKEGSKVYIKNGYVSEWQGEMQLGTGKYGSLEVVEETDDEKEEAEIVNNESTDEGQHILTDDEKVEEEVFEEEEDKKPVSEEDVTEDEIEY